MGRVEPHRRSGSPRRTAGTPRRQDATAGDSGPPVRIMIPLNEERRHQGPATRRGSLPRGGHDRFSSVAGGKQGGGRVRGTPQCLRLCRRRDGAGARGGALSVRRTTEPSNERTQLRSTAVVYVDAGYLIAASASKVAGTSLRQAVDIDFPSLLSGVMQTVERDSGGTVLRLYWYDAAKDGLPSQEQVSIGLLPRTKIRIGRLSYAGEQKGVDLRLGLDLVGNAQRRVAGMAYLVSGDDDLAEAVEDAQEFGTQVVLLGVPSEHSRVGLESTARNLALTADRRLGLPRELLVRAVTKRAPKSAPAALEGAGNGRPAVRATPRPVPAVGSDDAKRMGPRVVPPPRRTTPEPEGRAAGAAVDDRDVTDAVMRHVAENLVGVWMATASDADIDGLLESRPQIPAEVDRVLLSDAVTELGIYDLSEEVRHDLRSAFWRALDFHPLR